MGFASDISAFTNPFGAPSAGEWNLSKGIYTNGLGVAFVFFFETPSGEDPKAISAMEQVADSGGRRLAIYEYPYTDGQKVDDLGRKGETYVFNIKFFGENYQSKYHDFIVNCVNDSGPGTLLHPTYSAIRGSIPVRFRDYEIIHRHDEFNCITIKVTFIEDNTGLMETVLLLPATPDSALRSALETLTSAQAFIGNALFAVGALLLLPGALVASFKQRLDSITGSFSRLMGQLASTFSSNSTAKSISAQGGASTLNSGTISTGPNQNSTLPPVYQVGFDPTTQAAINAQIDSYVAANQITSQQAVFAANQIRQTITTAVNEINTSYGNDGYDIISEYQNLAISIQQVVESCLSAAKNQVKNFVVQQPMSLRKVAQINGLSPERQNDIELLNPYLSSINYIPAGTTVAVPIK